MAIAETAYKVCWPNGTWYVHPQTGKQWSNYSTCLHGKVKVSSKLITEINVCSEINVKINLKQNSEVKVKIRFKTNYRDQGQGKFKTNNRSQGQVRSKLVTNQGQGECKTNHRKYGQSVFKISLRVKLTVG